MNKSFIGKPVCVVWYVVLHILGIGMYEKCYMKISSILKNVFMFLLNVKIIMWKSTFLFYNSVIKKHEMLLYTHNISIYMPPYIIYNRIRAAQLYIYVCICSSVLPTHSLIFYWMDMLYFYKHWAKYSATYIYILHSKLYYYYIEYLLGWILNFTMNNVYINLKIEIHNGVFKIHLNISCILFRLCSVYTYIIWCGFSVVCFNI